MVSAHTDRYDFDNHRMNLTFDELYMRMGNSFMQFPHLFGKDHATYSLMPEYDNATQKYRVVCFVKHTDGKKETDCQTKLYSRDEVNQFIVDVASYSTLIDGEIAED